MPASIRSVDVLGVAEFPSEDVRKQRPETSRWMIRRLTR